MAILGIYVRFLECILHNFWGRNFISANGKPWLNSWSTNSWNILSNSKSKHGSSKFYLRIPKIHQPERCHNLPTSDWGKCLPYVWRPSHYISWYKPVQHDINMTSEIQVINYYVPSFSMSGYESIICSHWMSLSMVNSHHFNLWVVIGPSEWQTPPAQRKKTQAW